MLKDKDIREPLFDFFDEKFGKVRIIEEKQIAKSRADVMLVLEETLVGVEIKSDADRKSTRLNSSHVKRSRMPSSA